MSSADGKSGIPSNEELVNELTKDLKNSAIKPSPCSDDSFRVSESDSEPETRENEEIAQTRDEDYIDDDLLKERDEHLSEEEKRVGINVTLLTTQSVFNFKF